MSPIWAPKRRKIYGPRGDDLLEFRARPKPPAWWSDFMPPDLIRVDIKRHSFRISQVALNGLQLVPMDGEKDWWKEIGANTLHVVRGHWFCVITKAEQGLLLDYRGPTAKKRKANGGIHGRQEDRSEGRSG